MYVNRLKRLISNFLSIFTIRHNLYKQKVYHKKIAHQYLKEDPKKYFYLLSKETYMDIYMGRVYKAKSNNGGFLSYKGSKYSLGRFDRITKEEYYSRSYGNDWEGIKKYIVQYQQGALSPITKANRS